MNTDSVTIGAAFAALWPILTTVGGGYIALLGIIYKLMRDQTARLERQIEKLEGENKELRVTVRDFKQPLDKVADTSEEMNRTLEQMLDGIFPRQGRARGR